MLCPSITARGFSSPCLFSWDPCLYTLSRMLSRLGLDVIDFLSMLELGMSYASLSGRLLPLSPSSSMMSSMMSLWRSIQIGISILQ